MTSVLVVCKTWAGNPQRPGSSTHGKATSFGNGAKRRLTSSSVQLQEWQKGFISQPGSKWYGLLPKQAQAWSVLGHKTRKDRILLSLITWNERADFCTLQQIWNCSMHCNGDSLIYKCITKAEFGPIRLLTWAEFGFWCKGNLASGVFLQKTMLVAPSVKANKNWEWPGCWDHSQSRWPIWAHCFRVLPICPPAAIWCRLSCACTASSLGLSVLCLYSP